jgi:hypothetical protein
MQKARAYNCDARAIWDDVQSEKLVASTRSGSSIGVGLWEPQSNKVRGNQSAKSGNKTTSVNAINCSPTKGMIPK